MPLQFPRDLVQRRARLLACDRAQSFDVLRLQRRLAPRSAACALAHRSSPRVPRMATGIGRSVYFGHTLCGGKLTSRFSSSKIDNRLSVHRILKGEEPRPSPRGSASPASSPRACAISCSRREATSRATAHPHRHRRPMRTGTDSEARPCLPLVAGRPVAGFGDHRAGTPVLLWHPL